MFLFFYFFIFFLVLKKKQMGGEKKGVPTWFPFAKGDDRRRRTYSTHSIQYASGTHQQKGFFFWVAFGGRDGRGGKFFAMFRFFFYFCFFIFLKKRKKKKLRKNKKMRQDSNEGNKKKITMMMDSVDKHIVSILFVDISNFNEMLNYFGDHRELVEVKKQCCACVCVCVEGERETHTQRQCNFFVA